MQIFTRMALVGQMYLTSHFAGAANVAVPSVDRDSYAITVSWMHTAPTQTIFRAGDLQIVRSISGESETIGTASLSIGGVLTQECREMAIGSANGNAKLMIFTDPNAARYEIGSNPNYIIDVKSIRSCGILKK